MASQTKANTKPSIKTAIPLSGSSAVFMGFLWFGFDAVSGFRSEPYDGLFASRS